jgi:hypothetical protein|tara:strand:+ start:1103 stop:1381 length:279 start_codon:yes stop_codon:yes gene_type:complete
MKVLVNHCPHGFTLSEAQKELFPELLTMPGMRVADVNRTDDRLIASFEAGDNRGDGGSTLEIVEIPEGASYKIANRDGYEELVWTMGELNNA